ncbi:hypothetical protein A2801_02055 [Candidatus Woesebacteria bacterium RIFCSPHIGHO2_01_FULL_41_10]|uniref:Uncharacterized protein n=1 Tax=Candidatus Woesebacteria bacterium RIFCSPHIGHO2_01_FULL_41_10 TaxID=1802500 RepID=A0A1F7YPT8_9BACT|nr:MAG: hypothetical protein A2801_02055 [Candidatus Woesebacteria bacterium RIFCSPHIGHO2_01_FULL_41_10]
MAVSWQQNSQVYRRYIRNLATLYETRQDMRFFIEAILSLIVISIFGAFAIRPTLVTIGALNSEISSKRETEATLDQKIANLARAEELYNKESESIALLDLAIPSNPDPIHYTRQIEGIKKRNNTTVAGITLGAVAIVGSADDVRQATRTSLSTEFRAVPFPEVARFVPYALDIRSDYESMLGFLRDLESLLRPFYYDSVVISVSRLSTEELILSIGGKIPYFDPTKAVPIQQEESE